MRIQIENRNENPILNREEINFTVKEVEATPSRQEIRKQVAAQANVDEKLLIVDVLGTSYGTPELKGVARIYKTEAEMKKTELKYIIARNFGKGKEEKKVKAATEGEATAAAEWKAKTEETAAKKEEVKKETAEEKLQENKTETEGSPEEKEKPATKGSPEGAEDKE
ncbi:MAG: hypothetical protein ABIH20_05770 [Candidatus Diapherotrites archaeon]